MAGMSNTEIVHRLVEESHEKLDAAYSTLVASGEVSDLGGNPIAQRLRRLSEDLGNLYDLIEEIGLTTAEEDGEV